VIIAALSHILAPSGKAAQIGGLIKAGAYAFNFTAPSPGVATIDWYEVPAGAHVTADKRRHKPVLIASGHATFAAAGAGKVTVKLTTAGRKLLKRSRSVSLTAVDSFAPKGQSAVTKTGKFTLRR
jgi:hypothetical protein